MFTEKQLAEHRKLLLADFKARLKEVDPPPAKELEASVEASSKCRKCGGEVRATIIGAEDGDGISSDLELVVTVYCPKPDCGHMENQYRPWSSRNPKEL